MTLFPNDKGPHSWLLQDATGHNNSDLLPSRVDASPAMPSPKGLAPATFAPLSESELERQGRDGDHDHDRDGGDSVPAADSVSRPSSAAHRETNDHRHEQEKQQQAQEQSRLWTTTTTTTTTTTRTTTTATTLQVSSSSSSPPSSLAASSFSSSSSSSSSGPALSSSLVFSVTPTTPPPPPRATTILLPPLPPLPLPLPQSPSGSAAPEPPAELVSLLPAIHPSSSSSSSSSSSPTFSSLPSVAPSPFPAPLQEPSPRKSRSPTENPSFSIFSQTAILCLGHLPLCLVLVVPSLSHCSFQLACAPILIPLKHRLPSDAFHSCIAETDVVVPLHCLLRFSCLAYFQTWSLQSLAVAYALPLLCAFSPSLVLPLGIFHICSLIASGATLPPPPDHHTPHRNQPRHRHHHSSKTLSSSSSRKMDTTSSSTVHAAASSSSLSSSSVFSNQDIRGTGQRRIHTATPDSGTGSSEIHPHQSSSHQQQRPQHNQHGEGEHSNQSSSSHNHGFGHGHDHGEDPHGVYGDEDAPLEDEDGRHSDDDSDGEGHASDMEFWLQKCSICFDARLDFCLEHCRDQFCKDCFQRYVKEIVSNSWGLDVTKIKCPVCQDTIPLLEWRKYVDQGTLAQYHQYNQPYRSFSRFCNECDTEVVVSRINKDALGLPLQGLLPLFEVLLKDLWKLLCFSGFQLLEPSLFLSSTSPEIPHSGNPKSALRSSPGSLPSNNGIAQSILDKFADDCKLLCGTPQHHSNSGLSFSQTYFSSLAFRASRPPPPPVMQLSGQGTLTSIPQSDQPYQPNQPNQSSTDPTGTLASSNSVPQQKDSIPRPSGVMSIYKVLIMSLLELLDLKPAVQVTCGSSMECPEVENVGSKNTASSFHLSCSRPIVLTRAEKKRRLGVKRALVQLSKDLASLETRPDQWKELQFLHVRWLRWDWCHNCDQELCLQCGESSHHASQDCFGYMRSLVAVKDASQSSRHKRSRSEADKHQLSTKVQSTVMKGKNQGDPDSNTIQWKLQNTNPCPNCSILIHRDDGCNKVDCMLCGHRFCWVCRESWGVACGFFRCGRQPQDLQRLDSGIETSTGVTGSPDTNVQSLGVLGDLSTSGGVHASSPSDQLVRDAASEKPETGVPNVFVIQAKRSRA